MIEKVAVHKTVGHPAGIANMRHHYGQPALVALAIWMVTTAAWGQTPKPVSPKTTDIDARAAALHFWDSVLTKCGDSYYFQDFSTGLNQYRGVSFDVKGSRPLTSADQLNGIQWDGIAVAVAMTVRYFAEGYSHGAAPSWSSWMDGKSIADVKRSFSLDNRFADWRPRIPSETFPGASVVMTNRNGNWSFYAPWGGDPHHPQEAVSKRVSCAAIPAEVSQKH